MSNRKRPAAARPTTRSARSRGAPARDRSWLLPVVVVAVVVAAFAALIATSITGDQTETTAFDTSTAAVSGSALPPLPEAGADPAAGRPAPQGEGLGLDGEDLTVPAPGRPAVLLFLAHWCPHCQAEVPVVQQWLDGGGLPDDVDLMAIATQVDPSRPNHPPSAWLEDEGWTVPTLADASSEVATAYGLTSFPFWVVVDAEGDVVTRRTGELSPEAIDSLVAAARGDAPDQEGDR